MRINYAAVLMEVMYVFMVALGVAAITQGFWLFGVPEILMSSYMIHRQRLSPLFLVRFCPFCWIRNHMRDFCFALYRRQLKKIQGNPEALTEAALRMGHPLPGMLPIALPGTPVMVGDAPIGAIIQNHKDEFGVVLPGGSVMKISSEQANMPEFGRLCDEIAKLSGKVVA